MAEGKASKALVENKLAEQLERLKQKVGIGYEVKVKWVPSALKYQNGKELAEEVKGDTIFIYAKHEDEALQLVGHGFAEWILNQHSQPYRQLINSLITLFEEQQYEKKEKIVEALAKLMEENRPTKHKNNRTHNL